MPDRSFTISSFKYGLDTRRESLASLPGTLQTLQNAFINSGGEIEKRRAFVLLGTLPTEAGGFKPQGFQDTDTGIMVFSESANPGGLPTNIVWQQLTYPNAPATSPTLAAILFSTSFKGKSFALVSWDNEDAIFAYYNGVLVPQITDGIVLTHPGGGGTPETVSDLANDLAAIINRIPGWTAHANVYASQASDNFGYHESALAGSVLVMSPPKVYFTPVVENNNSVSGLLGVKQVDQNYDGVDSVAATAAFKITAGTIGDTIQISAPEQSTSQNPAFDLTNGAVSFHSTLGQTALDVATAINNNTFITGYSAVADNSTANVTVYAPTSFGAFGLNLVITTTGTMTVGGGTAGQVFKLTLTPATLNIVSFASSNSTANAYGSISASITGTSNPTTYTWTLVSIYNDQSDNPPLQFGTSSGNTSSSLNPQPITGKTCTFLFTAQGGRSVTAQFKCTASDGTSTTSITFVIKLSINVP